MAGIGLFLISDFGFIILLLLSLLFSVSAVKQ